MPAEVARRRALWLAERMPTSDDGKPWPDSASAARRPTVAEKTDVGGRASGDRSGTLLVIDGVAADLGTHVPVGAEVTVGRDPTGLGLRDVRASRQHCRVWWAHGGYRVEDLDSTNGTSLNGAPLLNPMPLREGDRIRVGKTILKFTLVDATEAVYLQRMEVLARRDALTGLHAKHHFDALLEDAYRTAVEQDAPLAVWMLDLDGLKAINDQHGHRMGAATIREVGGLLGAHLGKMSAATRFGGDEFCVYQCNQGLEQALEVAEAFRAKVEAARFQLDGIEVGVSVSIGVAMLSGNAKTAEHLVEQADRALYKAKEQGRNRVEVGEPVNR